MRHARAEDLDRVDGLVASLRAISGLTEKRRGSFYRGSRALLHFHEDAGDIICDVRLEGPDFDRVTVTSRAAQRKLVKDVRDRMKT